MYKSIFHKFQIYTLSFTLVGEILRLCKQSPLSQDFSLKDQLKRAACSIPANIAEGYGRQSPKEFAQFISIALGSANEMIVHLEVVDEYLGIDVTEILQKYENLVRKIYRFRLQLYNQFPSKSKQPITKNR